MALFRAYATAQITTYADAAVGAATTGTDGIDGTAVETLGADGTAPPAPAITYNFSAGAPLSVSKDSGLLVGAEAPWSIALVKGPAAGTLTLNPDGSFVYIPDPGSSGSDSFEYLISDGDGGTATGTVTLDWT